MKENDTISRPAAIELLEEWAGGYSYLEVPVDSIADKLNELPTAEKKGKWVKEWRNASNGYTHITGYKCSKCIVVYPWKTNYCPNCGARMEE